MDIKIHFKKLVKKIIVKKDYIKMLEVLRNKISIILKKGVEVEIESVMRFIRK